MQNDKPEPFNVGAETESGFASPASYQRIDEEQSQGEEVTPEQDQLVNELLEAFGAFLENAENLRVTLYAAQSAQAKVTAGIPIVSLVIPADTTDTTFTLGTVARNTLIIALATNGNLAVRIERGAVL